ncbi:hypothetical protein Tco_0785297 [Tanacetum coccineum]
MWSQTIVKYDKFALWGVSHWGKKRRQFYAFAALRESARDVYSKRRIIAVTKVEIVEWHDYKHLDWITVRRDDDALYKFKEGDFHRLRIQDIEDMLLLLVQGKMTNLSVEERIAFNVSLRMFTRSVVIQRRVEDLQLGVESYQKKLNLTKPDTYRSNLRSHDAYTPYSDPRGFIYENKDKKNRLMRIDELHKFSDGTLDDVRTALNDRLKGIRMEYLPQTFWSQRDKVNARAMIQAIDKRLGFSKKLYLTVGCIGASAKLLQASTSQAKASGSYSFITTSSSNRTPIATPGLDLIDIAMVCHPRFKKVSTRKQAEGQEECKFLRLKGKKKVAGSEADQLGRAKLHDEELNHALMAFSVINELLCGMSSTFRWVFGYGIKSNAEYKRGPSSLSGIYTHREQEDIDDSLYDVWELELCRNANSTVYSSYQSNDSDGEQGPISDHSVQDNPTNIPSIEQVTIATLVQKGKQHKASCKAKIDRYVTHPLHTLHMDLFGPTSVRSINHASYCLVITDDCSRDSDFLRRSINEIPIEIIQSLKSLLGSQLQLSDAFRDNMLQNEEIFAGLQNIGSKSGGWDQFVATNCQLPIDPCLSTGRDFNFSKLIFDGMISNLKSKSKFLMYPRFLQMILNIQTENKNHFVPVLLTKKIFGNMKRSFQGIHRPLLPAMLTIDAGQPQPSAAPTPSQHVPTPTPSHVQIPTPPITSTPPPITQPLPTLTQHVQSTTPPPQPSNVQLTSSPPPIQPVQPTPPITFSSPPITTIPDTQPTHPPSPQIPSPPYNETEGPSFEPSYHMSPPPSHEPEIQTSRTSEESEQLRNLLDLVPRLESRVESLEKELSDTKQTLGTAVLKLIKKVTKLENKLILLVLKLSLLILTVLTIKVTKLRMKRMQRVRIKTFLLKQIKEMHLLLLKRARIQGRLKQNK